jgi:hypothetical protein
MTLSRRLTACAVAVSSLVLVAALATGPAAADDTEKKDQGPSVNIGGVIFADYTYQQDPEVTDAAGNMISPRSFNITRAYLNVTGTINDYISFRVTPDITRVNGSPANINGSLDVRLKYAFLQFNLDKWTTKGSWVRFGLNQTPYIDYTEGRYNYRFQGPIFTDAEGYLYSSDFGASAHFNFPGNYGDVHFGVYNGDGYAHAEANDQPSFEVRAMVRPVPGNEIAKGLEIAAFYEANHYVQSAPKDRFVGQVNFVHPRIRAGIEYLDATDQQLPTDPKIEGDGYSVWASPTLYKGLALLLRYDSLTPDKSADAKKTRSIGGVAWWFPTYKKTHATVMLDYTQVDYSDYVTPTSDEKRWAIHTQVTW